MLKGKNALVIGGGGGGIGRAVTRALARAGSGVAVADVDRGRADEAADGGHLGRRSGPSASWATCARAGTWSRARDGRPAEGLGGLDVLVTVVGGQLAFVPARRLHEMPDDDWQLMFAVNLHYVALGGALGAAHVPGAGPRRHHRERRLDQRPRRPTRCRRRTARPRPGSGAGRRSVAAEYGRDGIRMNVVTCGPIATPVALEAVLRLGAVDWIPNGRAGESHEVAEAVLFLASPQSSYVSGQSLVLDGGATAAGPFPHGR